MRPDGASSAERLVERVRHGYGQVWGELDRLAESAAGERIAVANAALVDHLLSFDAVIVAGQAP